MLRKMSNYLGNRCTPLGIILCFLALIALCWFRSRSNIFMTVWLQHQSELVIDTQQDLDDNRIQFVNILYRGRPYDEGSASSEDQFQNGLQIFVADSRKDDDTNHHVANLKYYYSYDKITADTVSKQINISELNESGQPDMDTRKQMLDSPKPSGRKPLMQQPKVSAPAIEMSRGRVCLTGRVGRNIFIPCKPAGAMGPPVLPPETSIIETDVMPPMVKLFPEISNGHVATVVQGNSIFMNGLYNGANVSSHRARIPSTAGIIVSVDSPDHNVTGLFRLDLGRGAFSEIYSGVGFAVEVRRYAHRDLTRLLVTEIIVNRTSCNDPIVLSLYVNTGPNSRDIDFAMSKGIWTGNTREAEYSFVNGTVPVYVAYTVVPNKITFPPTAEGSVAFFTSVSTNWAEALQYYNRGVSRLSEGTLFSSHVQLWDNLWQKGRIEMAGNVSMALSTNAAFYYLTSALPLQPDKMWPFVGMSPGGLAHGAAGQDYNGHVFWDQDTWMFPPMMLLHSDLGRIIINTRLRTHKMAQFYATMSGLKGARYPWESAFTGLNVSPSTGTSHYELHVTGDTSLMMRQYIQLTNDTDFLEQDGGYAVISDIADFFVSRSEFNSSLNQYVINGVMGPDEYHYPVNNSVFTNTLAALSMRTAQHAAQLVRQTPNPDWDKVASNIHILYDSKYQYHPEYFNYTRGSVIKQADVILLSYPVDWPISDTDLRNDLTYYATVTPAGPAMTWGIFAINWLRIGEKANADIAFYKGTWNEQHPFKVWSENADGSGAYNFHTGMGGFLQSLLFGYIGFDLDKDYLTLNPQLPPSLTWMAARGVDYLGSSFDVTYTATQMNLTLTQAGSLPLSVTLTKDGKTFNLVLGSVVMAVCQPATIQPQTD